MNLKEILENSILLEAIRINNGREAYELIKNNKLGVKINPSYDLDYIENDKNEFISVLDKIIKKSDANNKVFAVQLFLNKIPMNEMLTFADRGYIYKAISYRNKPWAKNVDGYLDFISLNGKPISYDKLDDLVFNLDEEAQKHGHGDKKSVNELYNDGTWTLQIPTSFKGAKSISYYGKKGEKQIPTGWCTRANEFYYNKYTKDSPLYVIRNWENGKSYQIAFNEKSVEFLDQNDEKGDEIVKGDLSTIPDKLLSLIEWRGRTLKDFKESEENARRGEVTRGKYFKDPTDDLRYARWSDDVELSDNVVKNVWKNFAELKGDKLSKYMIDHKESSYVKHDGCWAVKYWFKNEPDFFILMNKFKGENGFNANYYWDGDDGIEELDSQDFGENIPNADKLLKIARRDVGQAKNNLKFKANADKRYNLSKSFGEVIKKEFNNAVVDNLSKIASKYSKGLSFKLIRMNANKYSGGFIPYEVSLMLNNNGEEVTEILVNSNNKTIKYRPADFSYNYDEIKRILRDKTDNFLKEIFSEFSKGVMQYSKNILNNREGRLLRNSARAENANNKINGRSPYRNIYYEDYFPY